MESGDRRLRFICRCGRPYLDLAAFARHAFSCEANNPPRPVRMRVRGGVGNWRPGHYLTRMLGWHPHPIKNPPVAFHPRDRV